MIEKTKVVEVQGMRYQIRRMRPNVGSFILTRVVAAGASAASMERPDANMLQGMFAAFLRGLDFDTFSFIQNNALSVVARLDKSDGGEIPMPIVSDDGVFADANVSDDLSLTMALTVQSLIFNLSGFFSEGGLNALIPR
jgi:hypothetical protein